MFESVIIALYHAFITTTTAQKAMEEYLNIKYSKEEGILGFHHDLVMWAGQLAQYPDDYSFKRRIMNGLPSDCLYHLTMYDKLTAEHSSMEDIVQKARHYEQTQCYNPGSYLHCLLFSTIYLVLSVTRSPLVPLHVTRTATESPDKSPNGSPDHSAVRYHMPSLRSPQHSAASPFNPLWIASSLPHHDRLPAHDGTILRTASS